MSPEVTPHLSRSLLPLTQQHPEFLVVATQTSAHLHLSSLTPSFAGLGATLILLTPLPCPSFFLPLHFSFLLHHLLSFASVNHPSQPW